MRLFIAVNFDDCTVKKILAVAQRLGEIGRGNFSRPENLHLTLAFLGDIQPDRIQGVREAMDSVIIPDLLLEFTHVGSFRREGGELWWLGLAPNTALMHLQNQLSQQLKNRGFSLENRRFSPHIALARQVVLRAAPNRIQLLGSTFATRADTISLMLSHRVNGKLTYTEQYAVQRPPNFRRSSHEF